MSVQEIKQEIHKVIEEVPEPVLNDVLEYLKHIKDTSITPDDEERKFWLDISKKGLSRAYSDDEPEYTIADVKEQNPLYKTWKKDK
jgi:hypothetical protein